MHLREKYDQTGKRVFGDANSWFALSEMFNNILQDSSLPTTYLVIDSLDESTEDSPKPLRLIAEQSAASLRVKWIVSSRNWPKIEQDLEKAEHKVKLSLELNAEFVSQAVDSFIKHKVLQLAEHNHYSSKICNAVIKHLSCNAEGTFLWVGLVCKHLEKIDRWNVIRKLSEFLPGLNPLYQRMLEQIHKFDSADICKYLLAAMEVVYRPVNTIELTSFADLLADFSKDFHAMREVVSLCGYFLTIRNDAICFVHQSARDFLSTTTARELLPIPFEEIHC